ncbi:Hypothetical predicted protein [Olea europaea subsp. europaea]|uniref:Hyaluronan/mRNA-binding protein domain-containing protein n=1 Tax=Olea europaea subsp. europaea TaxID=158383 RepID=A0A8S0V0L1_OLEEU|nr:Hypothetical predicted protein [Olea europaea subsp. europaea]
MYPRERPNKALAPSAAPKHRPQTKPAANASASGQGNEIKREGSGRGNWGAQTDELAEVTEEVVNEGEKNLNDEKPSGEDDAAHGNKETSAIEIEEKEPEDREMTLDEYEKILEERRKALQDFKTEERKVDVKEFVSMQQLTNKKTNQDVFIELGSFKDKKKELAEKEERAKKKSVSINEFLKPAEGEKFCTPGGRGRGRGRGSRGGCGVLALDDGVASNEAHRRVAALGKHGVDVIQIAQIAMPLLSR